MSIITGRENFFPGRAINASGYASYFKASSGWRCRRSPKLPAVNPPSPLSTEQVAALYVQHSEELRCFLVGLLRDSQLAADVLQATFVKMVERGGETQEETRKAWLFRVAYHEAMAIRRRDKIGDRIAKQIAEDGDPRYDPEKSPLEDLLVRHESVERVRQALEQLPPDQRRIVRMRIYEEKTFAVIAEELKIPLGTALGRMRAALIKLRTWLHENAADKGPRVADER